MLAELHPRLPTLVERSALWVGRRRTAAAAVGAAILGTILLAAAAEHMAADVPLFDAELRPAQTADVESALTLWGEPFRSNAQATQIFVSAPRRRDLLLRLTIAGLPRRYVPTSADVLADQANALTPQSIIDDRRRSGIEGDLVAGLRRIAGVADATVVLPPASSDPLTDEHGTQASAAVQLVMQPGEQLSPEAVAGVRRFVASAYPGLAPDRVTVVDASGAAQGATAAPDVAAGKERRVQGAVQSALDAVLGVGASVVRVSISTVGAELQAQSTRVVPHGPLSADVARERGTESGKTFDKERSVRRYAYDTLSERRITPADAQARLSIAVFLDANRSGMPSNDTIAALVRAAAGADVRAGDEVVVEAVPFASATPAGRTEAPAPAPDRAIFPAVVACALALFGVASLPRVISRTEERTPARRDVALAERRHAQAGPSATSDDRYRACERRASVDPSAARTLDALTGESPQTAAYVLASLGADVRADVLTLCEPERRSAIEAFLERT